MMNKYTMDIRKRGPVKGYSTTHSEHKHIADAKKPAKRTNGRLDSISQVVFDHKKMDNAHGNNFRWRTTFTYVI